MKPNLRYIAVALIVVLSGGAFTYSTTNQSDAKDGNEPATQKQINSSGDNQLKVFSLKHADAEHLSSTVRPLFIP